MSASAVAVTISSTAPPKPGKNKYLVWNSDKNEFDTYSIKLAETPVGKFLDILVAPPILAGGFLSYKKCVYKVSLHDLLRNHINVSIPHLTIGSNSASGGVSSTGSTTSMGAESSTGTNQSATELNTRGAVLEEHDIYWEEQVQSLLNTED